MKVAAVIGSGTMGSGIAQVLAQSGFVTHVVDAAPGAAAKAVERIHGFWAKMEAKGKASAANVAAWKSSLTIATDLTHAAKGCDLVIEAVPEKMELKQAIFRELDAAAPRHAILATNTSSLSIAHIAAATKTPERVVGLHFFNPVPLMQLLEIVRHAGTAPDVVAQCQAFATRIGKTSITVQDSPGFATSRLGIILGNEAMRMLEEGVASAKDIDTAMRLGYGHPMGPLELSDLVGLDVRLGISEYLEKHLGPQFKAPGIVRRLVAEGSLGKKTGKGLYDWSDGTPKERALP